MTTDYGFDNEPLWLAIEQQILALGSSDLANAENAIQGVAKTLDSGGLNVSGTAGHMMALRGALAARVSTGRPMLEDLNKAFDVLTLDDLDSPYVAASTLISGLSSDWPVLKDSDRRSHVLSIVEKIKLDLLIAKAKEVGATSASGS